MSELGTSELRVSCPTCSQQLVLPVDGLNLQFDCPRCGRRASGYDLVPTETPLRAIPVRQAVRETAPTADTEPPPGPTEAARLRPDPRADRPSRVEQLHDFGRRVLRVCAALDSVLVGRRAKVFLWSAALAGLVAPLLDYVFLEERRWFTFFATHLFFVLTWATTFAWLGNLRDEYNRWSAWLGLIQVRTLAKVWWDEFGEFSAADGKTKAFFVGMLLVPPTLLLFAVANCAYVLELAAGSAGLREWFAALDEHAITMRSVAVILGVVSAFCLAFALKKDPLFTAEDRATAVQSSRSLPAVVDLSRPLPAWPDKNALTMTLGALAKWKRRSYDNEKGYEVSLGFHMRRQGMAPDHQYHFKENHRLKIPDMILDDVVLIEVKRSLGRQTARGALGQMKEYARGWKNGPLLLVVFEDSRNFLSTDPEHFEELHRDHGIVTVRMPIARRPALTAS